MDGLYAWHAWIILDSSIVWPLLQGLRLLYLRSGVGHGRGISFISALLVRLGVLILLVFQERNGGDGNAEQVTRNGDLPVQRFLGYLDTVVDVSYTEALSRIPLAGRESQIRTVLFIQQVLRKTAAQPPAEAAGLRFAMRLAVACCLSTVRFFLPLSHVFSLPSLVWNVWQETCGFADVTRRWSRRSQPPAVSGLPLTLSACLQLLVR